MQNNKSINYTPFVMRQFEDNFTGTNLSKFNKDDLISFINDAYDDVFAPTLDPEDVTDIGFLDSMFPFCKYLVIPIEGTLDLPCAVKKIEPADYQFMEMDYSSRTPTELQVVSRWLNLPKMFPRPKSKYLIVILYTREQLLEEFNVNVNENENGVEEFYLHNNNEYGIVSLMGTIEPYPDPLVPITMMRNALGKEEGGNGTPIDREEYNKSVEFWRHHIMVK